MKINMKQWADDFKKSDKAKPIPIMTHPGIEMMGYTVEQAVKDGVIQSKAIEKLWQSYPSSAITMMMDLTVEAEAFGCNVTFSAHEVPSIKGRLIDGFEKASLLQIPDLNAGRIPHYLKAAELTAQIVDDRPLFAGCIGPFSLAGRLFDMTEIMTAVYIEPETISQILEKCSSFLSKYIEAFKNTGVNGIVIAEPAAGILPAELCDEFSSKYVKPIVDAYQDDYFMIVLHNCGNRGQVTDSMISTGVHALHFGNNINMELALQSVPSDIIVMGNLDPVSVFKSMNPQQVKETTLNLLNKVKQYKNFALSSGCDTPPGVSAENINAFYDAVRLFNS